MRTALLLGLGLLAVSSGCYRATAGPQIGTMTVPNSDRVVGQSEEIRVVRRPTMADPRLELRVDQRREIQYTERTRHQEMRVPSRGWNFLGGVLWLGVGGAGVAHGSTLQAGDTLTTGGQQLVGGGILLGIGGLYLLLKAFDRSPPEPVVNGVVLGGTREQRRFVDSPRGGQRVILEVEGAPLEGSTNSEGIVGFRMDEHPGFGVLIEHSSTPVRALLPSGRTTEFSLESASWMAPCVQAAGAGTVRAAPTGSSRVLGEFVPGDVLRLQADSVVDWFGVSYRRETGWVPRLSVQRCWAPAGRLP